MISHLHRDNSWGVLIAVDNDKLLQAASAVVVAGAISARRAISRTVHAAMQVLIALGVCACAQTLKWGRWLSATKKGVRVLRHDDINSWLKAVRAGRNGHLSSQGRRSMTIEADGPRVQFPVHSV